jgi:hypothetical protein
MLHPGIDLHKRTAVLATVDADGRPGRDVQLRVRLLEEPLTLLGGQTKRLAAELSPVLIPNPDVRRRLCTPGSGASPRSRSSSRATASSASGASAPSSPAAGSCPAPAPRAVAPGTSVRRTATAI